MSGIDFKGDGAFDRAYKVTCKIHNHKHLFFRECPECIKDEKQQALNDLNYNINVAAVNLLIIVSQDNIQAKHEIKTIINSIKEYSSKITSNLFG